MASVPEAQGVIIASQLPRQAGTRAELAVQFNRVDPRALEAIVARSTQDITAASYRLGSVGQEAMRRELVRAVAIGDNPRTAAARMVANAQGAFNGGLNRALTIARTEMIDAHRAASAEAQIANDRTLAGWQWIAQLDHRTCPSCWGQHGSRHSVEEPGPLDHQQGRCARLPVTRTWRELGFDIDEPPSVVPDARTVFNALPRDEQLAIMGTARLDALDAGTITFADLSQRRVTVGWRDSFAPTPVRQLTDQLARTA